VSPAKGLDIGTSRIVVAEPNGSHYHYKAQLNAFVSLPGSRLTESGLHKEGIPFKVMGSELVVYGDKADRLARVFCGELRRPMQKGMLNPAESQSLEVIEQIVVSLCGQPKDGERICFSVPTPHPGAEGNLTYHQAALSGLLEHLGFRPKCVGEGLAVVLAELDASNYTGVGISFGGGMCNGCLAYLGAPVVSFSTTKAGDYVDRCVARVTGEPVNTVRQFKEESFNLNGRGANVLEQALSIYYGDAIDAAVNSLERALSETRNVPKLDKPVPVLAGGGTAKVPGFLPRLEAALGRARLPISISTVRLAADPLNTTAKGALRAAVLE